MRTWNSLKRQVDEQEDTIKEMERMLYKARILTLKYECLIISMEIVLFVLFITYELHLYGVLK